ncbi:MAG: hypothetical protein ACPK85_12540 [Methanosarcina sp.]
MESKKILVLIFLVTLGIFLAFSLMVYQPGAGMYVRADKLQNAPENYTKFSFIDLEKYPCIKEAVLNPGKNIKVPSDQHINVSEFGQITSKNGFNYIKVNNEYYEISYESAD